MNIRGRSKYRAPVLDLGNDMGTSGQAILVAISLLSVMSSSETAVESISCPVEEMDPRIFRRGKLNSGY